MLQETNLEPYLTPLSTWVIITSLSLSELHLHN